MVYFTMIYTLGSVPHGYYVCDTFAAVLHM